METDIITSLIVAGTSIITTCIIVHFQNKRFNKKNELQNNSNLEEVKSDIKADMKLINLQIKNLTEEQKKYNNLQVRLAEAQTKITELDVRQEGIIASIDEIKQEIRKIS